MSQSNLPVDVTDVRKTGDWYVVRGVVNGRPVSADIPAHNVDGLTRETAFRKFKATLIGLAREGFYV